MPESVKTAGHRIPDVLKNLQGSLETRVRRSTDGAVCFASDQQLDGTVRAVHGGLVDMMPGNDSNPNYVGDALESAVGVTGPHGRTLLGGGQRDWEAAPTNATVVPEHAGSATYR